MVVGSDLVVVGFTPLVASLTLGVIGGSTRGAISFNFAVVGGSRGFVPEKHKSAEIFELGLQDRR